MSNLIETFPGQPWSRILENALTDNGSIVDVGCLHWDWGQTLVGKKRIIGIDPIEKSVPEGCELYSGVLGPSNGKTYMDINIDASNIMGNTDIQSLSRVEIEMLSWKTFCSNYNVENVSVLKIDVQGYEPRVLDGAKETINKNKPTIFIEVEEPQLNVYGMESKDIFERLDALGYEYKKTIDASHLVDYVATPK